MPRHAALPAFPILLLALHGCSKPPDNGPAQAAFDALAAACVQFVEARKPVVAQESDGSWSVTGYSPAQVQADVARTESNATPYVGKLIIKDNAARAHAATEAEARAITYFTPEHLQANRTHTFIYGFDGTRWHWQNGMRLTKTAKRDDVAEPLALADVAAPSPQGFAGCLPQ